MRGLKSTDLFAALRVVKEIGIKDEMKRMADALQGAKINEQMQTEVGMELIMSVVANCGTPSAEKAFFEFFSGVSEIPVTELREMNLDVFADKVKEFVLSVDLEHWKAFFTQLAGLIRKQK